MAFRRTSTHYGQSPHPETPYQKAGQVWDERMGSARVQARNWRLMAIGCLATTATFGLALVWQSTQGTIVPYVVEVDRLGAVSRGLAAGPVRFTRPLGLQISVNQSLKSL